MFFANHQFAILTFDHISRTVQGVHSIIGHRNVFFAEIKTDMCIFSHFSNQLITSGEEIEMVVKIIRRALFRARCLTNFDTSHVPLPSSFEVSLSNLEKMKGR